MSKFQKAIHETRNALAVAEIFALKYEAKLPEELGEIYIASFGVHYDIRLSTRDDHNRNKALAHLGEVFGRSGWESTLAYGARYFDWQKELDGVKINIQGAQMMNQPDRFPVDPKQFPLQIEDAPEVTVPPFTVKEVA